MATAFEHTGDAELVRWLELGISEETRAFGGACLTQVGAARRADARSDRDGVRMNAYNVIEKWSRADKTVPAVEEMRRIVKKWE